MEGLTFERVRDYLNRAEPFLRPIVQRLIRQALDTAEIENDYESRGHLYRLIRECSTPFRSNATAIREYLNNSQGGASRGGTARELIFSQLSLLLR